MATHRLLALETAQRCRDMLMQGMDESWENHPAVVDALRLCQQMERHANQWPATKLHRALGFVQGVLVALDLSTWDEQHDLVERLQVSFPETHDPDLADHLNPKHPFQLELGGSG